MVQLHGVTLSLAAADLRSLLDVRPMDGRFAEKDSGAFRPGLETPGGQVQRDGERVAWHDRREQDRFCTQVERTQLFLRDLRDPLSWLGFFFPCQT